MPRLQLPALRVHPLRAGRGRGGRGGGRGRHEQLPRPARRGQRRARAAVAIERLSAGLLAAEQSGANTLRCVCSVYTYSSNLVGLFISAELMQGFFFSHSVQ